ncbi:MAG: quinone-dependent dihydroorotate dehydrogenase [Alphaproteobacteria bacterium]|nr:quinone-dependent dihydroorotate dehydrogenase [Alphaproteobacteria bacterium]
MRVTDAVAAALGRAPVDPEHLQKLFLWALRCGLVPDLRFEASPMLATRVLGLEFPHPVGLAAGIDKDAVAVRGLLALGCASLEVGTMTLRPQTGNPRPRVFRLDEDHAAINRFGFNSRGLDAGLERLAGRAREDGIVGINLGVNSDSTDRVSDYAQAVATAAPRGDYLVVNVSSPNTRGLRDLQGSDFIDVLLDRVVAARNGAQLRPPLLLKIAPDLARDEVDVLVGSAMRHGIDGMIIGNTTVIRPDGLVSRHARERGGLSGAPLFALSTRVLAWARLAAGGSLPLVGAGGVRDAETAWAKIRAGADLVQLYTGQVFAGVGLFRSIHDGLVERVAGAGLEHVSEAVGMDAEIYAEGGV